MYLDPQHWLNDLATATANKLLNLYHVTITVTIILTFPSWIRIQKGKGRRIHTDPDPQPWLKVKDMTGLPAGGEDVERLVQVKIKMTVEMTPHKLVNAFLN